jgi:hypothetical protein
MLSPLALWGWIGFLIIAGLMPLCYFFSRYPTLAISLAILYSKSRQVIGEEIGKASDQDLLQTKILSLPKGLPVNSRWFYIKELSVIVALIAASIIAGQLQRNERMQEVMLLLWGVTYTQPNWVPDINKLFIEAVYMGKVDTVRWLLEKPGVAKKFPTQEQNALLIAARSGNRKMVELLIKNGAPINYRDGMGETVLTHLIKHPLLENRSEIIEYFITMGANLDIPDSDGQTALRIAQEGGQPEIVEMLKAAGARQ